MSIAELRRQYHSDLCAKIIRVGKNRDGIEYPNFADAASAGSIAISWGVVERLGYYVNRSALSGQAAGSSFEQITKTFLEAAFALVTHLRPGRWQYSTHVMISAFEQYGHLAALQAIIKTNSELQTALGGDYIITPDIVVGKWPVSDAEISSAEHVIDPTGPIARLTPFREANHSTPKMMLHASISCKWTIRSDRSQNARTEALNLMRNRKGRLPHVSVVTAEPTPWRLASVALGTGDLDCVYHFALHELVESVAATGNADHIAQLASLVQGKRLRDISDLPFDLAV